ncbi:S-adenosyl-L-methionine-dependent methyltransferase protein [Dioscorea alata]|uniref:S-adenosyl-L-methionine-dependent methyltransferase protein n=1 Tax=Dioscorea alata TaxID=55571 RepID=A0ACB7UKS1_DIOAL|nr:S-adenosyl-L-methionine-dependent methyltransferase protein [Dioscorea alata]
MSPIRSLIFKILTAAAAATMVALLIFDLMAMISSSSCDFPPSGPNASPADLDAAFQELEKSGWIPAGSRAISVGPDPGGAAAKAAMERLGFSTVVAASATRCCGLPFDDASFDFAFSAALDRVRVPARVILEMERVIRPGRVGVVYKIRSGPVRPDGLMKAAAPVASLLRLSDVIGARFVNGSGLVVFKKRLAGLAVTGSDLSSGYCEEKMTKMPSLLADITKAMMASFVFETSAAATSGVSLGHAAYYFWRRSSSWRFIAGES